MLPNSGGSMLVFFLAYFYVAHFLYLFVFNFVFYCRTQLDRISASFVNLTYFLLTGTSFLHLRLTSPTFFSFLLTSLFGIGLSRPDLPLFPVRIVFIGFDSL